MNANDKKNQTSLQKIKCPNCSSENLFRQSSKLYSLPGEEENHRKISVGGWILLLAGLSVMFLGIINLFNDGFSTGGAITLLFAGLWMVRYGVYYALFYILHDKSKLEEKVKIKCSGCHHTWIEPFGTEKELPPETKLRLLVKIIIGILGALCLLGLFMGIFVYD